MGKRKRINPKKRKSYADCMDELTPGELYTRLILNGLFSEKLPPVMDGKMFLSYCRAPEHPRFREKPHDSADYYSIRNTGTPRHLSIPVPMGYEALARYLREHWCDLQNYFHEVTAGQKYMVSRVHVRKLQTRNALFELNYRNWRTDGLPELGLGIGKRYLVVTDIANFFRASIWTKWRRR